MAWPQPLWYFAFAAVGALIAVAAVHLAWDLRGRWQIRRAGPRNLRATRHRIWREPAAADAADLRYGPGGKDGIPVPPFRFVEEHLSGSQPCVAVRDARERLWRVKWGLEVRPEAFAVRFAWACGYFAEITHFVPAGHIEEVGALSRARSCVDEDGRFCDARFELEDRRVRSFFDEHSWAWHDKLS